MTARLRLDDRLAALDEALARGAERLDPDEETRLRAVRAKAGDRLARGDRAVVVALAGGTGSGKSSLFNALAGAPLAEVGARRPVTADPRALAVGDPEASGPVLDWLDVQARHHVAADDERPDGLVLIDLPDHDSVERAHQVTVDRFVSRVDVLVWVVDPLKYAQRALHAEYLRTLATHAEVTLVVLNQADRLSPEDRATVEADLRALLDAEGLPRARVLVTSATDGDGVDALRSELADEVRERHAIAARIAADIRAASAEVRDTVSPMPRPVTDAGPAVATAVGSAVGLDGMAADAERAYVDDARHATRPLVSGLLVALLARVIRPLRRWRSERARRRAVALRVPTGELPVGLRHALLELVDGATEDAAPRWRPQLRALVEARARELTAALARDLDRVEIAPRRRRWWFPVRLLWTTAEVVALAGATWLVVLGVVAWLQLPAPPTPDAAGGVPLPTALLLGGAFTWLLIAWVRRSLVRRGARRHRRRVADEVAADLRVRTGVTVLAPLTEEIDALRDLDAALERAASG